MVLDTGAKTSTLFAYSLHASRAFDKHCVWMTSEEEVNPSLHSEQGAPTIKKDYKDNANVPVAWNSLQGEFSASTVIDTVSWFIF